MQESAPRARASSPPPAGSRRVIHRFTGPGRGRQCNVAATIIATWMTKLAPRSVAVGTITAGHRGFGGVAGGGVPELAVRASASAPVPARHADDFDSVSTLLGAEPAVPLPL